MADMELRSMLYEKENDYFILLSGYYNLFGFWMWR